VASEGARPDIPEEDAAFVREALALLPEPPWTEETWATWTAAVRDATGRKGAALFKPLRLALTGTARGPDMAALMPLLHRPPRI
jgi:glutamyl-tRNA synthetase